LGTSETACYSSAQGKGLRVEAVPFERVPHQSRLFLAYLKDPSKLRRFYPESVRSHVELPARAERVLAAYKADRAAVCDALEDLNRAWGAQSKTIENVNRLRSSDAVAVVSGQQAGLFTGPLYTIYKALSAVKLAACLSQRGTEAVPVFWMASEDHDWPEVRRAKVIGGDGQLADTSVPEELHAEGQPVGAVRLDTSIEQTIDRLCELVPSSEFTDDLRTLLRDCYQPGRPFGESFARLMTALTGDYGLVLLDPMDGRLKRLAAPIYADAARLAPEIADAIVERSRELEQKGFHAQVHASPDAFPLFFHEENGARHAVARTSDGRYAAKGAGLEWSIEELAEIAAREPERFSPNVTLRSVVQDHLLPTIAYYGGAAEIAYFAQTAEVYRLLERPVTPILHRSSLTFVERSTGRTLERYGLRLEDFFAGIDAVTTRVVEEHLGTNIARAFDATDEAINAALDRLREQISTFDPTLGDALETGRRKIEYQLQGLRSRFHRAHMTREGALLRQLERAATVLYPEKALQERHLNITSLLARHGRHVVDWIHDAIDISASEHQTVYL
jgi:bacillithiol biosynthesis cysteine-adding enzyme BshC